MSHCTVCDNEERSTSEYHLEIQPETDKQREEQFNLCEACAADLLSLGWIRQHGKTTDNE